MNTSLLLGSRARVAAAFIALSSTLAFSGCKTSPSCTANTVEVTLTLDNAAATADELTIVIQANGQTSQATSPHAPGVKTVPLELLVPNYTEGEVLVVQISASLVGEIIAQTTASTVLDASCTELSMALAGNGFALPVDMAQSVPNDLAQPPTGFDLAGFGPTVPLSATSTNKIDILFMVDNSPSMDAMQAQLQTQFAQFLQPFVDLAALGIYADLHIGVVTSDYGAGDTAGGGCDASPGGQRGILQSIGAAAGASCAAPVGAPFIEYQFGAGGDTSNLPVATSTAQLTTTFGCMASVGAVGCGFEHQLESVFAALKNTNENAGFLRADALLAVVFLTNEDDGSAPPDVKFYESTADVNSAGAYDTYRQTRFGVACVQGGVLALSPEAATTAPLMGCEAAPTSLFMPSEYDISRYTNFFTNPIAQGGIKDDPTSVMLIAIDAPETPFQTLLATAGTGLGVAPNPSYVPCPALASDCVVRVEHSCQNNVAPSFFGDPAVRLNTVVRSTKFNEISSICGDDLNQTPDYTKALATAGALLRSRLGGNCMPTKLANPTAPTCDVIANIPVTGSSPSLISLPRCDQGGDPCWSAVSAPACAGISPDNVTIEITATSPFPSGTTLTANCK